MNAPNGAPTGQAPSIQIAIVWTPSTGQIQIAWPQVDDTIKLGMLEMAKCALIESRRNGEQQRVMPVQAMPKLH